LETLIGDEALWFGNTKISFPARGIGTAEAMEDRSFAFITLWCSFGS
jgi:hypothetical protein